MLRSTRAVVVGAGIAGAATAWRLASDGFEVVLIDSERPAAGASGRNPGFLWLQTKTPGSQLDLALAGRAHMQALDEEIGGFGWRACGGLIVVRAAALEAAAHAFAADRVKAGLPVEVIRGKELRSRVPGITPDAVAAIWNPLDAHQDTRRLVHRLVDAAGKRGASMKYGIGASALETRGGRCTGVRLRDGSILGCDVVVLCNGYGANALLAPHGLDLPMTPVRYEAMEIDAPDLVLDPVLCGQSLFAHFDFTRAMVDDARPLAESRMPLVPDLGFTEQIARYADGRVHVGCAVTVATQDDRPTLAGVGLAGTVIARNLPALAAAPVNRIWAGIVAQTPDYLPIAAVDYGLQGLALNVAHAFGNLAGALSGQLVADLAGGRRPSFPDEALSPARFA